MTDLLITGLDKDTQEQFTATWNYDNQVLEDYSWMGLGLIRMVYSACENWEGELEFFSCNGFMVTIQEIIEEREDTIIKKQPYTPSYLVDNGIECFIAEFKGSYHLYESNTEYALPSSCGEYVGYIDNHSDPFRFIPDLPAYPHGFPNIKALKHFYNVMVPANPNALKTILENTSIQAIEAVLSSPNFKFQTWE